MRGSREGFIAAFRRRCETSRRLKDHRLASIAAIKRRQETRAYLERDARGRNAALIAIAPGGNKLLPRVCFAAALASASPAALIYEP